MEALVEAVIIAEQDLRASFRSTRAIVFLVIYALMTLASGGAVVWATNKIEEEAVKLQQQMGGGDALYQAQKDEAYRKLIESFIDEPEQVDYLVGIPVIVLFFFWAARKALPLLIVVMCFDQINGETVNRTLRYSLLRARRGSVIAGKLLSNMILTVGMTAVMNGVLLIFAATVVDSFDVAAGAGHLLRFWLLILPLGLCYVAMMSFLSTILPRPGVTLGVALLALFGFVIVGFAAAFWEQIEFLKWTVPWTWSEYLSSHRMSDQLMGVGGYTVYAAAFAAAAWITLRRRDV